LLSTESPERGKWY